MKDDRLHGISCFSGVGGLDLAIGEDVQTVCYIEWDSYCQKVLQKRMQEGFLDDAPIWADICSFDGSKWAGRVDIVFGGFPCQDISVAGKGAGIKQGTRSGLFFQMLRVIGEIRPRFVFLENVSAITNRGLDVVLGCLSEAGYDAVWTDLRASDVGAPHRRERWFCLAYRNNGFSDKQSSEVFSGRNAVDFSGSTEVLADSELVGCVQPQHEKQPRFKEELSSRKSMADSDAEGPQRRHSFDGRKSALGFGSGIWDTDPADFDSASESFVGRVVDGCSKRVDRLKCLGNAVVPQQGREAWRILTADVSNSAGVGFSARRHLERRRDILPEIREAKEDE